MSEDELVENMEKRILFITESYYDSPSPNGNCVRILAEELIRSGNAVSVLTLKNQTAKKDSVIDKVKVFRINTYAEWRIMFANRVPGIIKRIISRVCKEVKNVFIPLHPFRAPLVLAALLRRAKKIIKDEQIDTVVGVYRDFETAYAAILLKKKYPNIKVCIYTLDAISGGVCSNRLVDNKTHIKKCNKWELVFLKHCDRFCIMKSHAPVFESSIYSEYRKKIVYLDIPNLCIPEKSEIGKKEVDQINFVYTGMLSETNADCRNFLKVFEEIIKREDAVFNIYGGVSEKIFKAIEETGLYNKKIYFHGRVTQEELKAIRRDADVLLNFGNNHPCGIPCKIFEYMATGKVILSFKKIKEDASTAYLTRYAKALLLEEKIGNEKEHAEEFLKF